MKIFLGSRASICLKFYGDISISNEAWKLREARLSTSFYLLIPCVYCIYRYLTHVEAILHFSAFLDVISQPARFNCSPSCAIDRYIFHHFFTDCTSSLYLCINSCNYALVKYKKLEGNAQFLVNFAF